MKYFSSKRISDSRKIDHLENSFGSAWSAVVTTFALLFIDNSSGQLGNVAIILGCVIIVCSVILDVKSWLFRKKLINTSLDSRYSFNLAMRLMIYLSISCLVSLHIMYFPLLSWQSILGCAIFIGGAERLIYQNYYNPKYAQFLLIMFQVPVAFAGFSLGNHNAKILAGVICVQCLIHLRKIRSFYNIYKTKNDLQQRLEDEKAGLNTLLNLLPVGVTKFDTNLNYVQANKYITNFSNKNLEDIVGKKLGFTRKNSFDLTPIELFVQGPGKYFEMVMNFFDERTQQSRRHQTYWQKISSNEIIMVSLDIEDLMQTKENLQQEREFSLSVLNAVPDPIFVKDKDHKWIYGNDSFSQIMGRRLPEYIYKSDRDFYPPEIADLTWRQEQQVLHSSCATEQEEFLEDSRQEKRVVLTKKTPFLLSNGETILVGVMRDITDRRRLEMDLLEKSKFASLGQMAAGVAHEINNPLAIIEGKAELLARQLIDGEEVTSDKIIADLRKITETTARIAKIIKSMRVLAHNHDKQNFEPVALETFLNNSLGICFEKFKIAGVVLTLHVADNLTVNVDPTQMGQVLVNLAMNSFDAVMELPRAQQWIQIITQPNPRKPGFIDILVVDGGTGIPFEIREKIMNPFFTTKKVGKGTGLGLSLSKTIVLNHGGEITIDPNHANTCFVVSLPLPGSK